MKCGPVYTCVCLTHLKLSPIHFLMMRIRSIVVIPCIHLVMNKYISLIALHWSHALLNAFLRSLLYQDERNEVLGDHMETVTLKGVIRADTY